VILFTVLFAGDTWLLYKKTQGMDLYDELHHHLSVLTTDIVRLEYVLDISVITKNFDDKRGGAIATDIANIGKSFKELARADYAELFKGEREFVEVRDSMMTDWGTIYSELQRLSDASTEEELLLIHNVVDMNTFILSENAGGLMEFVQERKNIEFDKRNYVLLVALAASFFIALISISIFFFRLVLPFERFFRAATAFFKATTKTKMAEDFPGDMGRLSKVINEAFEIKKETSLGMEERVQLLEQEVVAKIDKLNALNLVSTMLASSLSQYEIFMGAVTEVLKGVDADAGAVYLIENDTLKLKVSKGFSETFFYKGEDVPLSEKFSDGKLLKEPKVFKTIEQYPEGKLKVVLFSEGIRSVISTPILSENGVIGFFDVAFREEAVDLDRHLAFLQAIAANMGVAVGYSELFIKEHATSNFLERLIQQTPYGLAVFEKDGVCAMANSAFKSLIGGDPATDFVGNYNIFDDEEFIRQGLASFVKNSYGGRVMNFVVEYKSIYLGVERSISFKVRSFPLYDAAGNIAQVGIFFDPIEEL
jgi:PAS domain-containing protein